MILVDTSIWIEHLRNDSPVLRDLLSRGVALIHPFVIGELACGNLSHRTSILKDLSALPPAVSARDEEVLRLIEDRKLWGRGIGWIDSHLLASTLLSNCRFWTIDERLNQTADNAGISLYRHSVGRSAIPPA
jgi:predicted nucleic acid-binding protein